LHRLPARHTQQQQHTTPLSPPRQRRPPFLEPIESGYPRVRNDIETTTLEPAIEPSGCALFWKAIGHHCRYSPRIILPSPSATPQPGLFRSGILLSLLLSPGCSSAFILPSAVHIAPLCSTVPRSHQLRSTNSPAPFLLSRSGPGKSAPETPLRQCLLTSILRSPHTSSSGAQLPWSFAPNQAARLLFLGKGQQRPRCARRNRQPTKPIAAPDSDRHSNIASTSIAASCANGQHIAKSDLSIESYDPVARPQLSGVTIFAPLTHLFGPPLRSYGSDRRSVSTRHPTSTTHRGTRKWESSQFATSAS
jgi:hypothetical protein